MVQINELNLILHKTLTMKLLSCILLILPCLSFAQIDTINGFTKQISGEEINYFSPLRQFAPTALLSRANGTSEIVWEAPTYSGKNETVCFEILAGHSTGTSKDIRYFDLSLNGNQLVTIKTIPHQFGNYTLQSELSHLTASYEFKLEEFDIHKDGFGKLYITVPAMLVKDKAVFSLKGRNQESPDWFMIFEYEKSLKIDVLPTTLISKSDQKRQVNLMIDYPEKNEKPVQIFSSHFKQEVTVHYGYNQVNFSAYTKDFNGIDTIYFQINDELISRIIQVAPVKDYTFYIIHHSHNDIGYSHIQTEVAEIQISNIRSALKWTDEQNQQQTNKVRPIWHIESLWAVENFLRVASKEEEQDFVNAVKSGNIVLSANYANILTGLSQQEELIWMTEYARKLEKMYGFKIENAMITDVPGISWAGLNSYIESDIPYLSLGPNYVKAFPDKGDRVGGVIREQGDKIMYWSPSPVSDEKVLVWTAGKGYSFFHGIADKEKQMAWEQRLSAYCTELTAKDYPYDMVQLRYTKKSDNGPVDTLLCSFIETWNNTYESPRLELSSVNNLFREFERKYGSSIPVLTGEISPYWEDGAYSTAVEEMANRDLVYKTIQMEAYAKESGAYVINHTKFEQLHRNILLFHEHTWGSWCSISDPEIHFTTEQWRIKKEFLDSALINYNQLAKILNFTYQEPVSEARKQVITDFTIDLTHGGIRSIQLKNKLVEADSSFNFFEPVYVLGITPSVLNRSEVISSTVLKDNSTEKIAQVIVSLPTMQRIIMTYTLSRQFNVLQCHYTFTKTIEKNKESMHICFPFKDDIKHMTYGSEQHQMELNTDQLPGSNKDFICVEDYMKLNINGCTVNIRSPKVNLFEIGNIVDENKVNGVKKWKTDNSMFSDIFLYVFNNYWHTNYKAYQEGNFEFTIEMSFDE